MNSFWSFFIRKKNFSFLLIITLLFLGIFSLTTIPKESTPEVTIPIGIVTTVLPGASSADVEKLVTNKIEGRLEGNLPDLKELTSTSREGVSTVVAEFTADADLDKAIQDLKDAVDNVQSELPAEVDDSFVSEISFVDQPILSLSIAGDLPPAELGDIAKVVQDELERIPSVSRTSIGGYRNREIQVIVDKNALSTYGLRLVDVVSAIGAANATLPIGSIRVNDIQYNIEFDGGIDDPAEIQNIALFSSSGQPVYVRDIAFVSDGLEDAVTFSRVSLEGEPSSPALSFDIYKRAGGDITQVTQAVRDELSRMQEPGGVLEGLEVAVSYDSGEYLRKDLVSLVRSGLQTVLLVMLALFISLGWREALIASLAVPLSFLIAFIGLEGSGNTLNFISLFSLILSIGILVDSAIVMVEGIHTHMKRWEGKREAALQAIREYSAPLISGTLTTVAVFVPLFFLSGITGEFIASIPFTIISVLLASLFVALGIIPLVASLFMRRRTTSELEERQEKITQRVQQWYRGKLGSFIGNRRKENSFLVGLVVAFVVAVSFPLIGVVEVIFFPAEDSDFVFIDVELPQGSTLGQTDIEVRKIEEMLYNNTDIDSFTVTVGQSNVFSGSAGTDSKLANIFINLSEDRAQSSQEIMALLRNKTAAIHTADVRISEPSSGPPVGKPILIQFLGDDLTELDRLASRAGEVLKTIPGTTNVLSGSRNDSTQFVLRVDAAKATAMGISPMLVAQTLRTAVHGSSATSIIEQDQDVDVIVKLNLNPDYTDPSETADTTIDALRQIEIATSNGPVLLGSVLSATVEKNRAAISHEDGQRISSVTSELAAGGNTQEIIGIFRERAEQLTIPGNITMKIGGELEEVDQTFRDMFKALIFGMLLMLAILVLQFDSYRFSFYILVIVPFSLIGIFAGLALTRAPLSFPSILGFIALSGIVVNNAIILISVINDRRRETHIPLRDAVIDGSVSRLRPILLTTITTVIGVFPLIFASELWGPLAYSIMFGLTFSVIITLLLVPILYSRWPGKFEDSGEATSDNNTSRV